jgi:hypothetical protein
MSGVVRTFSEVAMDARTLIEIKRELEAATTLRSELWHDLSRGADPEKAAEIARLNAEIEALWGEARAAQNRERFGDPAAIQKRARAEERLERDLRRVA